MPAAPTDKPRRFYETVSVEPVEGGFVVKLDERRLKTPGSNSLLLPTETLAEEIAAEWEMQEDEVDTASMPLTRLAFTAIDRGAAARKELAEEFARYAGSDVLCYRAEAPAALAEREAEAWDPWLNWAAGKGIALHPTVGVGHKAQAASSLRRAEALALEMDDLRLTGLVAATALFGSAVLGLAVAKGALGGEEALDIATLDERFQAEKWGVDEEAAQRTALHQEEARNLETWFRSLGAQPEPQP